MTVGSAQDRNLLDRPVTTIAQVVLFWGALQLILSALDAYTKWDMLKTVRTSLPFELTLFVGPWAGLFLTIAALGLLWGGALGPKTEESASPEDGEPFAERYSVFGATKIPLFLALVCGLVFWDVQRRSPHHPPVGVHATTALEQVEGSTKSSSPVPSPSTAERDGSPAASFVTRLLGASWTNGGNANANNPAKPDGATETGAATSNTSSTARAAGKARKRRAKKPAEEVNQLKSPSQADNSANR